MRSAALPFALALFVASGSVAHAREPERPAPRRLRAHAVDLETGDTARVETAIEALAASRHPYAVEALSSFLRAGQPDSLAEHALGALGETRSPLALPVLTEFTRHRRAEARRQAYRSIGRVDDAAANAVLARGLRDGDPGVRAVCAEALGRRRAREHLGLLFLALDRGVPEAGAAIGRAGDESDAARLHERLGRLPIATVLAGDEAFLGRTDIDENTKLDLVARLGEVAVPTVRSFLEAMLATLDLAAQPRLRAALGETARRIAAPAAAVPR
jgi:HEAT repeat protein